MTRADDDSEWFTDAYGCSQNIGTIGSLTDFGGKLEGWKPPVREFPYGFHCAAPGPSHPEPGPPAPPPAAPAKAPARPRKPAQRARKAKA